MRTAREKRRRTNLAIAGVAAAMWLALMVFEGGWVMVAYTVAVPIAWAALLVWERRSRI